MLYEVITRLQNQKYGKVQIITTSLESEDIMPADRVITSYSIHYTKLYDLQKGNRLSCCTGNNKFLEQN